MTAFPAEISRGFSRQCDEMISASARSENRLSPVRARSRPSLRLHIGETGSQPRASAFFKLSNSVCRCSECRLSALSDGAGLQAHPISHLQRKLTLSGLSDLGTLRSKCPLPAALPGQRMRLLAASALARYGRFASMMHRLAVSQS